MAVWEVEVVRAVLVLVVGEVVGAVLVVGRPFMYWDLL